MEKTAAREPALYGPGTGIPHPVDLYVGRRIRLRRLFLGLTLETLADALGLTHPQVRKYEVGANRVSASRLSEIGNILGVPISFFFPEQHDDASQTPEERKAHDRFKRRETIELVRLYYALPDERVRQLFLDTVKAVAGRKTAKQPKATMRSMGHRAGK